MVSNSVHQSPAPQVRYMLMILLFRHHDRTALPVELCLWKQWRELLTVISIWPRLLRGCELVVVNVLYFHWFSIKVTIAIQSVP
jgi:hypothetical protein